MARSTNVVCLLVEYSQPMISPAKASITNAGECAGPQPDAGEVSD
jgi:hypothetical protein